MMFDVAIVVMHQHYAVYLVDKMKSRRTATSKSLIHTAGKHSETVSRASAHCCHTLDVLKNNRSSNELLKLFIIKLQETQTTRDTFEILVNLVKSRGFVEIEANIRSRHKLCMREELLRRCGIEGGATLVDDGFAVFFFSKREQLSKKQNDRISNLKEVSRRLDAVDLINRLLQIEFSGQNCFECNAAALTGCLLASLCFPCHRKLRNIALPKNTSSSRLINGTENCIRPCMRYRRLQSVLTIAIFMCLRRQKLRRRPSTRFINALVEELLRAIFVINLLRKWLVMLWWQWLWSIMKSRHKCTAITSCPLGYSGESCTHSRRFIWPHVVANSPSQGNQRSHQKTISQSCRQNETAVLDRCVPSGTGHSNLCFIEYLLTSVVNAFHDGCDNFISLDANGTTNKEVLAVETFWEDFETCFCTKKGSGYNAVGQLLLSQLPFNNSKASHPVIKSKMLEGLPNQNHLPGNKVSTAPLKLKVAPQEAMNLPKYLQNWSTQPKSSILLPPPLFDNFSSVDLRDSCNPSSNELISEIVPNEEPEKESNEVEIAIIATSCRLPGGVTDESELWDLLKSGRNTASRIPANRIATRDTLIEGKLYGVSVEGGNFITQDVSGFDPSFFNISTSEAENMDPQQRLLLECVQECIENAGVTDTSNVGVFVGLMETEYPELMKTCRSISSMLGSMYAFVSGRINYVLGSHGPSITVDTACSSSLVAADLAISALKSGRCTTAIVAGVNLILSEKGQGVRANGNMLSRHGMSLSFDARASGYGRSDGCVALMIEQVRPGKVYMSRIVGMNVNHGGRSASLTTPNPQSQQELISTMLRECGRDKLQYWEAHGTGTRIGDLLEMKALSSTFQNLTVGTIKASIGHGEAAAGASALLKLSLMLKYNYIPPLVNFHVTSSKMTTGSLIFPVVGEERSLEDCGVTSFGVSGTNAAALLSKSSEPPRKLEALRKHYFVPVSAKSMESLNMMVGVIKNFLLNTNENMEDITGAFAFHKNHYSHRCAVVVDRQGREIQKLFGACHKPAKGAALVLSDADVSYDMLQNPGYSKHFDQLMSDQGLSDKDKLLISFIRFAADVFRSVDVYAQTNRELILALIAFSSLPANQVSTEFLQMKSRDELVVGLAKFGITPLTNILLNRHIGSPQSSLENPSMIKIHCDKSFVMTHYNFLFTCAHLYTNGLDLDFSRLYTRPLRYVKIPTYAFNRRSLWYVTKPPIFDHYLLGMLKEETRTSSIFQNWLDNVRQPHLFKGSIIGIGAIIEVVHAALSKHGCDSICVVDIKIMQLKPVSPCLLETKVESMNDLFLVSARLDDHDFFICIASAVKEDEMKKLNTKLQRHYACGKEAAQMRPFCIPHAKNSMVMVTEDLRYASVKIKHSDSQYLIAVEASVRMNPSLVLTSFHCVSCLPSSFELLNIISGDRALTLVSSQYKTLMLLSFCDEQRCSSTAYLEQILLHSRITTSNTVSKASTSAEEQYVTGLREAVTNFQRYTRIINTLLSYGAVQRQPLKSHLQTAVSHEIKKKEITHLNAADETDENEITPAPKATYNKGHNSDTFGRLSDIYCAEGDTKCANIRTPEEGIIMVMEQMPSEGMHNSRNTGNLSKSNPDEILGSVLNAAQDVLSQQIPINEETLSTGFIELGLESLNMVEFVSRLNEKYFPGMNISTADIFDYPTIKQLAEHIRDEKMSAPTYINDTMRFLNYKADKVLESVLNAAQDVLSQQIPISDKTLSMGFIELGLESLNMIEFVSRLNEKYFPGMNISTADVFDYPTIKQLADHLREEKMNSSTIKNNTEKLPNSKADKILESVLNAVQDVLSTRLSINDGTLSMGFIEMGLESLNIVEFVSRLNEKYFPGMNISIADTFDYPTIEQLAEHIREQKRHSTTKNNDTERFSIWEADKTLESVRNAAQDVLSQQIPINEETLSMGFIEMGLESLSMVEFVSRLNEKYFPGVNISTADIFDYPTIKQLAERIRGKTGLLFPDSPTSNSSTHFSPVVSKETFVEPCTTLKILVGGGSQECSAYTEVFEKEEGSADVLLTSWNDGTLSIVNLHDGSKLKLDSISLCAPNPLHIIERGATVRFNSEAPVEARSLFFSLLLFARRVLFDDLELRISVSNSSTLANALARSFFKTLAAEKFPKIRYIYNERLVKVHLSLTEPSSSIGGNWLITGGLSGIGLTIAKWLLLECSVENLVLISRRVPDEDLVSQLHQLQQRGNIIVVSANVADFEKLRFELERIPFKISGVIHSAGIVRDSAIERQTAETFSEVFAPKGDGYHAVDKLLRNNGHNLDHFIVMSSFTVVCGNAGQLNYAVSNAYLDHQMYLRRMEGKPGTTIHWGNWLDTGMARKVQSTLVNYGFMGLTNEEALKYLRYAIIHKPLELTVANVDWETVLNRRPDIRQDFVMDWDEKTPPNLRGDFMNQLECCDPPNSSSSEKEHVHIDSGRIGHRMEVQPIPSGKEKGTENFPINCPIRNATAARVGSDSTICNILGLNVFFDSKDDFCESIAWHIEALHSKPSLSLSLQSSKRYVLPVIGKSLTEIQVKLEGLFYKTPCRSLHGKSVMMFAGQGPQYPFMGEQLSTMFPIFRKEYEKCLSLADTHRPSHVSLLKIINNPNNASLLQTTSIAQTIIFAFGYACAMLWHSFGFRPNYYLGHSVGELVAGVVAGIMTLEEGIRIVVKRGFALEKIADRGAMLAIDSTAQKEIVENFKVSLAAVNSSKQVVIAGTQAELLKVFAYMKSRNIRGKLVNPKYPFHSPLIRDEDLEGLREVLETINFKEAQVPVLSNVSGDILSTFSTDYLIQQTISPVELVECIRRLEALGVTTWLEAGPASTMTSFLRSTLDIDIAKRHDILQTASDKGEDAQLIITAALALERQGVPISWFSIYQCDMHDAPIKTAVIDFPLELKKAISDKEKEILQGHNVSRENLIPGAYQIYHLLRWINAGLSPDEHFSLVGTKFVSPWKYDDRGEFKLIRANGNVLKVNVDGKLTCISHARFTKRAVVPYLNKDEIRRDCTIHCDVQEFYRTMANNGLEYRNQFQVIKTLKRNDICTYSTLQVKHPHAVWTLFDAALHAVCASILCRRPDVYFVPIAMGEVWMSSSLDFPYEKSAVLITKKIAENEKLIEAHACLFVDDELIFQYKSMLSLVMKSAPREEKLPVHSSSGSLPNGPVSVPTPEAESRSNHHVPEEEKGVYIVGYDGIFCFDASDNLQLWQAMKSGRLQKDYKIRECPKQSPALMDIDVTEWDPEFFGISPKEAKCVDVLQRFMMKSVVRCMENAGWTSVPKETGIFIGVSGSDFNNRVYSEVKNEISGYFGAGSSASCVAGRIAHWLRTEGPAVVVDTACSSSFVALACALDAISQGKCDHAIVGGINIILHDTVTEVLKNAGVLSAKGTCRVFDAGADGYVRSEAVGCILLSKNSSEARFRIRHWAVGHNGHASSLQVPNGTSQERLMRPLNSGKVDHVECHGTGTSLGDPIEIRAVSRCCGAATISSIKHLVGHAEAASGIVSLLACLEQMKHNYRTAQRCFACPNPKADFGELVVSAIGEEVCVDRMAINNFGFCGTNCSIVAEKLPERIDSGRACTKYYLAPLSSADKGSLKRIVEEFKAYVEQSDQLISDICTRLQKGRPSYRYRHCILYDFRRHIVWETGEPTNDSELFMPLHLPALMAFAYGPGFSNYDQNNSEGNFTGFFKQLIPGLNPQKMPTHPMTPCRFHQFIANSYTDGYSINWTVYSTEAQNKDTLLPHYQFNNRKYWPFEKQFVCNFPTSASPLKQIYYEKTHLKVSGSQRDCSLFVISVGKKIGLPNLKHCTLSELQLLEPSDQKRVVLYHPVSSSINEALELIALWQTLESQSNFVLVVACKSNGTAYTEWTALCRTLASERLLPYKFVSYSSYEELESEFSLEDIFECVFYEDSYRYVERLVPLKLEKTHFTRPQHLLITGGTGGIGKHLIEFMNAKRTTVITRNARHVPSRSEGPPRTFVESDLVALSLPEDEHYDVVVHCAGAVDNALMASMDRRRFENVCQPKCVGFSTLLKSMKKRNPRHVVVASSVASILGSRGQANYAFANGLMTSIAERSESPTMVIHWGPWKNTGMLEGNHASTVYKQLRAIGWEALEPSEALEVFNTNATNVMVFRGDFELIAKREEHLRKFLSEIVPLSASSNSAGSISRHIKLEPQITERSDERLLVEIIARISGIDRITDERDTPLVNLGMDSLMIEELRVAINREFDCAFKATDIYDNCTLDKLNILVSSCAKPLLERTVPPTELQVSPITSRSGDIAIIGYSGAFSGCKNVDEFWDNLLAGKECISRADSPEEGFVDAAGLIDDVDKFDHNFWRMPHDDASMLDPQLRVFIQNVYHSLERSGYIRQRNALKIGVFAGAEPSEYGDPSEEAEGSLHRLFKMNMKDFVSTFTAHMLNLRGPAIGVYSACSTALVAIAQACDSLRLSNIDLAIAGGVSLVLPGQTRYEFEEGLVMSKSGVCRPFDSKADGTIRGSAVGCVVLKKLDRAIKDNDTIHAVIKSYGLSNDGLYKASFMAPNSSGQKECLGDALAHLSSADINRIRYVECHGTGTLVGDEIEIESMRSVYGGRKDLTIGSVKANIGHGFAASGIAGLFKVMKILQDQITPPQINLDNLQSDIPFQINKQPVALASDSLAAVSSFGIGGTNAHIVLGKGKPMSHRSAAANPAIHILPISGSSEKACVSQCRAIAEYLRSRSNVDLEAVAATLQQRREHFKYRAAFAVTSVQEAVSQLESFTTPTKSTPLDNSNICFLFAPQGVQYANMEKISMDHGGVFKNELERLIGFASKLFQVDFMEIMYPTTNTDSGMILTAEYAQVVLFIISRAVLAQLDSWGISSDFLIGHSVGEYAAACYSGIIDEFSCMKLLKERGELVCTTKEAKMLAVVGFNGALPDDVEVTAHLSDSMKCVVGPPGSIEALKEMLWKKGIAFKELSTEYGFHSPMMDHIQDDFVRAVRKIPFRKGTKKIVSNINGEVITEFDSDYCWNHMRKPVNLKKCLDTTLSNEKIKVIVEIGPAGIVRNLLAERSANVHVVHTVLGRRRAAERSSHSQLFQSLGDLWALGYDVDFGKVFGSRSFDPNMPVYQFDQISCWREKIINETTARYFKASWSLMTNTKNGQVHVHQDKTLIISSTRQNISMDCSVCKIYSAKPLEAFSFSPEELTAYSLIVYLPESDPTNVSEPFLLSRRICQTIATSPKSRLVVISLTGDPIHWTTVGPIKQYHLGEERKNVFVDNSEGVPIGTLIDHILSTHVGEEDVFLATPGHLLNNTYVGVSQSEKGIELGGTVVVIGGGGAIGSAYVDVLRKRPDVQNIVIASRYPKERVMPKVSYVTMDLDDRTSVASALDEVQRRFGTINTIIHAAGLPTAPSLTKTTEEMLSVLHPKVMGVLNVLDYLSRNNLSIDNLVMTSSLSSVVTLQGADDYSAANLFLDALALKGHANVNRILAVQWPSWKDAGMASTYKNDALKSILFKASISTAVGRRVIRETLGMSGVVTYSPVPPPQMAKMVEEIQLKGNARQSPTAREHLSLIDKVISVWSEILCTEIHEKSDFFNSGGNSLSALRVVWSLNKLLHSNISVDLLFKHPILDDFVKVLPQEVLKEMPPPFNPTSLAHLTYSQENMYLLRQLETGNHYNIIFSIYFRETSPSFSFEKMILSIHSVIARQHSLRTSFVRETSSSAPRQVVHSLMECYQHIPSMELVDDILVQEEGFEFNLEDIPLRIRGVQIDGGHVIVFNQHHILTDGWSVTVLAEELKDAYKSYSNNEIPKITPLPYSISEYAEFQRQNLNFTEELEEFKVLHEGREATTLPQRRSFLRPAVFSQISQFVPAKLISHVKSIAKAQQTTEFVVVLSAFLISLRKFKTRSHENSVVIGYPVSGRNDQVKDLIGYFLNNVVLAVDIKLEDDLKGVIPIIKAATTGLRKFEKIPFHELVAAMSRHHPKGNHLFEIFFNYRHQLDFPTADFPDADAEIVQTSMNKIFDLSVTFDELPEGTRVMMEYNSSKYRTDLIRDLVRDMLRIFGNRAQISSGTRSFGFDHPLRTTAQHLGDFKDREGRTAIRKKDSSLSYQALYGNLSAIARFINDSWVKSTGSTIRCDDVVTVDLHSNEAISAILAILQVGAAYAPMEKMWPDARKAQIIGNVDSGMTITDSIVENISKQMEGKRGFLLNRTTSSDLIYVIHTSGSLGTPKGVAVSHRNVSAFLRGATPQAFLRPGRRVSHSVNVAFDVSVFNIFGAILNGCELCMHDDIRGLPKEVTELQCDVLFLTSAMLDALTDAELNRIQKMEKLFVGGDAVQDRNLLKLLNSGLDVAQIYGPTEGTVWSLTNRCKALPEEGSLIGTPMLNETCWLAEGVKEGELVLSGAKVARGYFNDPSNDSFYRTNGVPCYRTGDIVRNDKEGSIYRGRIDSQMKVRGHRIESLEVERAILETSLNILEAKVIALKELLVAFIVHDKPLDIAAVVVKLEATLPSYMVPSRFVRVLEIPLNSSGKVNKEKLLEEYSRTTVDCAAPTTTQMSLSEQRIASVFEKLLGLKNVRSTDNLFTLGGHSLLLFELKNQLLTEFDLNIEVHDLFANLTVQEMARFITKQSREAGDTSIITKLREAPEAKFNVYLIHAIGGSVFPYYAFLQVFPRTVNIYAIEYQLHFEADTIKQLAAFYARAIAAHTRDVRPFPMGHSLGGTISREIVAELMLWGWEIPFVMMFDTWMVQQLNMERVTAFAKKTFLALPDYEDRVKKTTRLADMLRRHTCAISTTKIYLFKSAEVSDDEAFRRVVRPDLNESILRAMTDNRLGSSSTQPIDVWLIDGNHESCMKLENLITQKETILTIFTNYL